MHVSTVEYIAVYHIKRARGGGDGCCVFGLKRTVKYVKNTASQGSANGSASGRPEAPKFGQLAGRSVFNTPSGYHPFSFY